MQTLQQMFTRRWLVATILVVAALAVLVRLGIWQLDRLAQRREFNSRVSAQLAAPELVLDGGSTPAGLDQMEYRAVSVRGEYDPSQQVALRNQYWENEWGVHLITPLHIQGSDQVVLVDRGWIPAEDYQSGDWSKYDEPGVVEVQGMIRASQSKAQLGSRSDPLPPPGQNGMKAWYFVNIPRLKQQMPYDLLPAYVEQGPTAGNDRSPYRLLPELELTEGNHLSYAIQWFTFALILAAGYPVYIRRQENKKKTDPIDQDSLQAQPGHVTPG